MQYTLTAGQSAAVSEISDGSARALRVAASDAIAGVAMDIGLDVLAAASRDGVWQHAYTVVDQVAADVLHETRAAGGRGYRLSLRAADRLAAACVVETLVCHPLEIVKFNLGQELMLAAPSLTTEAAGRVLANLIVNLLGADHV